MAASMTAGAGRPAAAGEVGGVRPVAEGALRLRPPRPQDEDELRRAHAELVADDFCFLLEWEPGQPWDAYLRLLERSRRGDDVRADRVPATFLVAQVGDELVGRVSIRHALNHHLAEVGGHIGYAVRPAYRRRGYATLILRQALVVARAEAVDRVLVTCDDRNAASAAAIVACGGVLEDTRSDEQGRLVCRYWID